MQKSDHKFWNKTEASIGAFHYADRSHPGYIPDLLIVFVHGLQGHYLKTWGSLPRWVLAHLNIEANVFSFSYPAKLWHETRIETAGKSLKETLEHHYQDRQDLLRNIVFVTHSAGGLVVNQMLRSDRELAMKAREDVSISPEFVSVWHRTRLILHIDVPHLGGDSLLMKLGCLLYTMLYYLVIYPGRFLARVIPDRWGHRPFKFGRCEIIFQLQYRNPWLLTLHNEFIETVNRVALEKFPRPFSQDIIARVSDVIASGHNSIPADTTVGASPVTVQLPGGHHRVKLPKEPDDWVVQSLARYLAKYLKPDTSGLSEFPRFRPDYVIAERTASLTINQPLLRVDKLAHSDTPTDHPSGVSQQEAFTKLAALSPNSRRCVLLTGQAGLGKSSVLRSLARDLSCAYLANPGDSFQLPVFFPLPTLKPNEKTLNYLSKRVEGLALWKALVREYCRWARRLTGYQVVTDSWIDYRMKKLPTVLILDGVDEFLMNSGHRIGLGHVRALISELRQKYSDNSRLVVILGMRDTLPTKYLDADEVITLRQLTDFEITHLFPWMKEILEKQKDERIKVVLRNPIVASVLKGETENILQRKFQSEAQIWRFSIEAIIKASGLRENRYRVGTNPRVSFRVDQWMAGLIFIGWRLFAEFRPTITLTSLRDQFSAAKEQWLNHFKSHHFASSGGRF